MFKYLASLSLGALLAGVLADWSSVGGHWLLWLIPLCMAAVLGTQAMLSVSRQSRSLLSLSNRSEHLVDARIDKFTTLDETFLGRPLCLVDLTVHSEDFKAFRTSAVTLDEIRQEREVDDEISVQLDSLSRPDVRITRHSLAEHEFGPSSHAPPKALCPVKPQSPRTLVPVTGEFSRRAPRSKGRSRLAVLACVLSFALGVVVVGAIDTDLVPSGNVTADSDDQVIFTSKARWEDMLDDISSHLGGHEVVWIWASTGHIATVAPLSPGLPSVSRFQWEDGAVSPDPRFPPSPADAWEPRIDLRDVKVGEFTAQFDEAKKLTGIAEPTQLDIRIDALDDLPGPLVHFELSDEDSRGSVVFDGHGRVADMSGGYPGSQADLYERA